MATEYTLNGTTASLKPSVQRWRKVQIGRDHEGIPLYTANDEIDLEFDSASITFTRQWMSAASSGSCNITVLNKWSLGWTDLSAVTLEVTQYPSIEATVAGAWSATIRGASVA